MIRNISKRSGESAFSVSSCYWNISSTQNSQGFKNFSSSCILSSLVPSNSGRPVEDVLPSTFSEKNLFRHCKHPRTASIIGAPMSFGQPFVGTDSVPKLLRERGLGIMLTQLGWRVEDTADLDFHHNINSPDPPKQVGGPNVRNCAYVGNASNILAEVVETKINQGFFPLILGGDHSISIGTLTGILRSHPNTGVIWVDAHADLNTPESLGSGNFHGMPLGLLMDHPDGAYDFSKLPGFEFLVDGPRISPEQLVYIGLRDIDPTERVWIKQLGIKTFTMTDVDHLGIGEVMSQALDHLKGRPLHLSYDIDSVDPVLAPATGTKVRGGLTYREANFIAEYVSQSGNLASAELVEINPNLSSEDDANKTVELGLDVIKSFMGKYYN